MHQVMDVLDRTHEKYAAAEAVLFISYRVSGQGQLNIFPAALNKYLDITVRFSPPQEFIGIRGFNAQYPPNGLPFHLGRFFIEDSLRSQIDFINVALSIEDHNPIGDMHENVGKHAGQPAQMILF